MSSTVFGQFGKLKKALQKKGGTNKIQIDWEKQKHMPAISLSSYLSKDGIKLELDGTFKISTLEISFLPRKDKKGDQINYDPYEKEQMLLTADLYKDGKKDVVNTFYFTVNPVSSPLSLMTCIHRPNKGINQTVQIDEGQYTLKFHVAGEHVHTYSFSVEQKTNDDTYAALSEMYFLDGAWRKYGRLSYNKYVDEEPLFFEFYILNNTTDVENEHRPNKQKEIKYSFKLFFEGKVVAASDINSDGDITQRIANGQRGYWGITGSQFLHYPAGRDRRGAIKEFFTEKDLKDGRYRIELEREKFQDGMSKEVYEFDVKNQKIQPLKIADRQKGMDKNSFIEQGPDYHFIKRTK